MYTEPNGDVVSIQTTSTNGIYIVYRFPNNFGAQLKATRATDFKMELNVLRFPESMASGGFIVVRADMKQGQEYPDDIDSGEPNPYIYHDCHPARIQSLLNEIRSLPENYPYRF